MSEHGTVRRYNQGCRCNDCRRASSDYHFKKRRDRAAQPVPPEKHGTLAGYLNYMCRCDGCRKAHAARMKDYMRLWRAKRRALK